MTTKSDFFGGLLLSSHTLKGTFASIIILSACLAPWLGVCSFLAIIQVIHNYGKLKISVTIPK